MLAVLGTRLYMTSRLSSELSSFEAGRDGDGKESTSFKFLELMWCNELSVGAQRKIAEGALSITVVK